MLAIKKFAVISALVGAPIFAQALVPPSVQGRDVVSGKDVTVQSTGHGLVVVFLSAKCPCSKSHVGELVSLAKEYKELSFVGVHSNQDESEELARNYFQSQNLPFPVIRDDGARIADDYKAAKTPHAFIKASSGEPLFQGGMSDSKDCADAGRRFLREALSDIRSGKNPRERSVRTLGCAISRRKSG